MRNHTQAQLPVALAIWAGQEGGGERRPLAGPTVQEAIKGTARAPTEAPRAWVANKRQQLLCARAGQGAPSHVDRAR